jgi:mRNA-degrading endonuclease toxin of MazEF toxin-antitoxin module
VASKWRAGQIAWAVVKDHNGFRKSRPVIIITPDDEIMANEPIVVMAVTTTFPEPAPSDHVELPWNPDRRRTSTHLARRSAAVITWIETVYADEITQPIGTVPSKVMKVICDRLTAL